MKPFLVMAKILSMVIPFLIFLRVVLICSGFEQPTAVGLCAETEKKFLDSNRVVAGNLEVEKERIRELLSSEISLLSSGLNANGAGLMQMRGIFFTVLTGAIALLFAYLGPNRNREGSVFVVLVLALFVVSFYAYDGYVLSLQERVSQRVTAINVSVRELANIDNSHELAKISTFPRLTGCIREKIVTFFLIRFEQALIFLPASLACLALIWFFPALGEKQV